MQNSDATGGSGTAPDPLRMIVEAEEKLFGFRQNLVQQAWSAAVKASDTPSGSAEVDNLVRLHAAVLAIDFALANRPSAYAMMSPL